MLGSALTKLKDDGTKSKTKVFAGGAVIAEQVIDGLGARVEWITADPFNAVVSYAHDKAGRLEKVEGAGFLNVSTYADNVKYRAFGSIKQMNYGTQDNALVSMEIYERATVSCCLTHTAI